MNTFMKNLLTLNPLKISILIVVIGVVAYVNEFDFLEIMEKKTIDMRFRSRGETPPTGNVVLAVIDEKSIDKEGKWVWPRSKFADLINKLSDAGAKVIAFDVGFFEPDKQKTTLLETIEGIEKEARTVNINNTAFDRYLAKLKHKADSDQLLANAIKKSKANVVLGYFFQMEQEAMAHYTEKTIDAHRENSRWSKYKIIKNPNNIPDVTFIDGISPESNIKTVSESTKYAGYFNMLPDNDGVVRRLPTVIRFKNDLYAPLSIKAVEAYKDADFTVAVTDYGYGVQELSVGDTVIPTDSLGQILINYRGPGGTIKHISITDILHGTTPESDLKDKIVLVGATAVGIFDLRVTPFEEIFPGPEIHANVIDSILKGDFLYRPDFADLFDIFAIIFCGLFLGFLLPRTTAVYGIAAGSAVFAGYILLCQYLFTHMGWILNLVYPLCVLLAVYVIVTAYRYFIEEGQKRFIKNAFSTYLAPSIVKQLMDSPEKLKLGGEKKKITAFFSDIQGFTSISEKLQPEELVELLNEFLTEMTDIILAHEGTVDKFEGDAIIAFFGAPNDMDDHAKKACDASIKMQKRMAELRVKWAAEGKPELKMRIGLSTGPAVVGNMGSKNRMDYTMMGDTVNTAARLEGVNKVYGIYMMVGPITHEETGDSVVFREIDSINVVGKKEPVTVYQPIDFKENVDETTLKIIDTYTKGLTAYRGQDWNGAIKLFEAVMGISPGDGPSMTMIKRCQYYKANPPDENWNGAFTMQTK